MNIEQHQKITFVQVPAPMPDLMYFSLLQLLLIKNLEMTIFSKIQFLHRRGSPCFFFSFFLFGKFWNWSRIKRIKEQDRETAETGKNVRAILVAWSFWCHFPGTALQLEMLWKISFTCSSKINERKVGRLNHQSQFISILINFCMPLVLASRNLALQARNICFRNKEINKRRWKNETSATGT